MSLPRLPEHPHRAPGRRFLPGVLDPTPLLRQLTMTLPDLRDRPELGRDRDTAMFDCSQRVTDRQIAEALGVARGTVQRWKHGGRLRPADADRLAVRCGFHPAELWADWYSLESA